MDTQARTAHRAHSNARPWSAWTTSVAIIAATGQVALPTPGEAQHLPFAEPESVGMSAEGFARLESRLESRSPAALLESAEELRGRYGPYADTEHEQRSATR